MRRAWVLCACVLAGCASTAVEKDHFRHAMALLDAGDYARATLEFERFLTEHPLDPRAKTAEELRIFAGFRDHEYALVETLAERFLKRYPGHPHADYVQYMLGRALERQTHGPRREIGQARKALAAYRTLLRRYPDSRYAADARVRAQRMLNLLAEHELGIARFYFRRGRYVAAANRAMEIVARYATTPAIEEALFLLAASQQEMGLADEARDTFILLSHNYPSSPWTERARRWLSRESRS